MRFLGLTTLSQMLLDFGKTVNPYVADAESGLNHVSWSTELYGSWLPLLLRII